MKNADKRKKRKCFIVTTMIHLHAETKSTIMTNEHSSLEKYTPNTLFEMVAKGLCVRGELETKQNCNILTPDSSGWAAQSVFLRAHSPLLGACSLYSILSPTRLTLNNWTSCRIGLYHCLKPTCFLRRICTQFNPSTVKFIHWYLRPDAPVPWSTAGSKVNNLQKAWESINRNLT